MKISIRSGFSGQLLPAFLIGAALAAGIVFSGRHIIWEAGARQFNREIGQWTPRNTTATTSGVPLISGRGLRLPSHTQAAKVIVPLNRQVPLELVGTVQNSEGTESDNALALLRDLKSRDVKLLEAGEKWLDYRLLRVYNDEVIVRDVQTNQEVVLRAFSGFRSVVQQQPEASTTHLSRFEINHEIRSNINNLMKSAVVEPVITNGIVRGVRLKKITRYKSIYGKVGLQEGDIIEAVNGEALSSLEKAYQLWEGMRVASQFFLTINRKGKQKMIEFTVGR